MSPEQFGSTNMWLLLEDEYFFDNEGEKVTGPLVVRVHEFPQVGRIRIQGGKNDTEIEGMSFEGVVQKER